jgi:putative endonuclease
MPAKAGIHRARRVMDPRAPCVYILASQRKGTLYVGVTGNLVQRVWQHKTNGIEGFMSRYGVKLLVFLELHATMADAILCEKQLKKWNRAWKIALIQRDNPGWRDLYVEIAAPGWRDGCPLSRA